MNFSTIIEKALNGTHSIETKRNFLLFGSVSAFQVDNVCFFFYTRQQKRNISFRLAFLQFSTTIIHFERSLLYFESAENHTANSLFVYTKKSKEK